MSLTMQLFVKLAVMTNKPTTVDWLQCKWGSQHEQMNLQSEASFTQDPSLHVLLHHRLVQRRPFLLFDTCIPSLQYLWLDDSGFLKGNP